MMINDTRELNGDKTMGIEEFKESTENRRIELDNEECIVWVSERVKDGWRVEKIVENTESGPDDVIAAIAKAVDAGIIEYYHIPDYNGEDYESKHLGSYIKSMNTHKTFSWFSSYESQFDLECNHNLDSFK